MVEEYKITKQAIGNQKISHHHNGHAAAIITVQVNIGLYIIACSIITYMHITSIYSIVWMYTSIFNDVYTNECMLMSNLHSFFQSLLFGIYKQLLH